MATEYPASTVSGEGIAFFADRLAEASHGRLGIAPSYDAALKLKSSEIVAAIRDGRLAAGCAFGGTLGGIDPLFLLSSLPFVTTTEAEARALLDRARPLYTDHFDRQSQHLLYATPWPPSGLWARKRIVTPADLAGLRLRVYDATGVTVFAAAGARPVNLSFAEAAPRLADGSIDAILSSGDGGAGRKLWEHLPYFTEIGYAMPLSFATVGQSRYDQLSPDLRAAVDAAAAATQIEQWHRLDKRVEENLARLRANNVTITSPEKITPALRTLLAQAASGAIADWKKQAGPDAAKLL
ncbi:TRAP-type C4-dicarboxylate transport system, substrate-binding protein [Enhydrobacter aerosaccus]|uniref:TRAP-type C4-dicarboxylate transport system, substrate-binding protein n=2 Tax=Enhydrobacter aerosaccus TaxID=225324 RepID=A0A1T4S7Z3_9HYPH|nr:TRAP-type C4-dicarboxylate transport system, substrate-binding protein [Enhydrobacter aerosaccus]